MPSVTTPSGVIRARTTRELFKKAKEAREQRKRDKKNKSNSNDGTPKVGDDIVIQEEGTNKEFTGRVVESPTGEVLAIAARTVPRKEQIARENERKRSKAIQQARENLRPVGQEPRREIVINDQTPVEVRRALPIFSVLQRNTGGELRVSRETNKSNKNMLSDDGRQFQSLSRSGTTNNVRGSSSKSEPSRVSSRDGISDTVSLRNMDQRENLREERLLGQIRREQNLERRKENIYSNLGIGREDQSLFLGTGKAFLRLPGDVASQFYVLGGRAAGAFETLRSPSADKSELVKAAKETPRASVELLKQSYNPKTAEGRANLLIAAAPFIKGGVKAAKTPIRRFKQTRSFNTLESSVQQPKVPFKVFEATEGAQRNLFGKSVPESQIRASLESTSRNKIGFGIERNPLRPINENILSTGQQRLATDRVVAIDLVTRETSPVRVQGGQPFVFRKNINTYTEFVPGRETLRTVSPQPRKLPVDITRLELSRQTVLESPKPKQPRVKNNLITGKITADPQVIKPEITRTRPQKPSTISQETVISRPSSGFTTEVPKGRFETFQSETTTTVSKPVVGARTITRPVLIPALSSNFNSAFKSNVRQNSQLSSGIAFSQSQPQANDRKIRIVSTPIFDLSTPQAIKPRQSSTPQSITKTSQVPIAKQTPIIPPLPPTPNLQSSTTPVPRQRELPKIRYDIPNLNIFDTPSGYTPRRKKQTQTFTPSFSATLFDIRGKVDTKQRFTGLGFRPIPLR